MNNKLLASVRFYFAQSVFNTNCHYKAYDRLSGKKKRLSLYVVFISAITLIVLIFQIIGLEANNQHLLNVLAVIGLFVTAASIIFELFNKDDLSSLMCQHKIFAEKYKSLRDEYMSLLEEILSDASPENELRIRKEALQKRYSAIGEQSPETTKEDYTTTQKSLGINGKRDEEFTWSDKEIDKFLPKQLRLN